MFKPKLQKAADESTSVDDADILRFSNVAEKWWKPNGPFKALHQLNPTRLAYIRKNFDIHFDCQIESLRPYEGLKFLDIGCGGGLLSEPLARLGAKMTAIDADSEAVRVASHHAQESGLNIDYRCLSVEQLASRRDKFDAILAMEIVEHVNDLQLFVKSISKLLKPEGILILATLNRTLKSFALAIIGAEYVLGWVPPGTHNWNKFVKPSEISRQLRDTGLRVTQISGVVFDISSAEWQLNSDVSVNYMIQAKPCTTGIF